MSTPLWIVIVVVVGAICTLVGYIIRKNIGEKAIGSAEQKARNLILDAQNKSETIKKEITLEAKEEAHRMRTDAEREVKERRAEIQRAERRLIQKEESVDKKLENIEKRMKSDIKYFDIGNLRHVDLVVDTEEITIDQIVDIIYNKYKKLFLK